MVRVACGFLFGDRQRQGLHAARMMELVTGVIVRGKPEKRLFHSSRQKIKIHKRLTEIRVGGDRSMGFHPEAHCRSDRQNIGLCRRDAIPEHGADGELVAKPSVSASRSSSGPAPGKSSDSLASDHKM